MVCISLYLSIYVYVYVYVYVYMCVYIHCLPFHLQSRYTKSLMSPCITAPSNQPTFLPSFLPSSLLTVLTLPSPLCVLILLAFLPSFLPSFYLPNFLPSFLLAFLPACRLPPITYTFERKQRRPPVINARVKSIATRSLHHLAGRREAQIRDPINTGLVFWDSNSSP